MKKSSIPNKTTALALNQQAIEGIGKYLADVKQLTIEGTTFAPADLTAALQAEIDAEKSVVEGRAQYKQQVVAAQLARSKGRATRKLIKTYVLSSYGATNVQTLETFGIPVPKPLGPKTAKSKAQAADKAIATRKAHQEAIASVDAPAPGAASAPGPATPVAAGVTTSKS
jgi:hypothetical protein